MGVLIRIAISRELDYEVKRLVGISSKNWFHLKVVEGDEGPAIDKSAVHINPKGCVSKSPVVVVGKEWIRSFMMSEAKKAVDDIINSY